MTTLNTFVSDITFVEVALSLLTVGALEHAIKRLPESVVGPEGWLMRTDND